MKKYAQPTPLLRAASRFLLGLLVAFVVTACADPVGRPSPFKLDYSQLGQIHLAAQSLGIINRANDTPTRAPYVGHLFKPTITDAVYRLADDRIKTTGAPAQATLIIKEASITAQALPHQTGSGYWFTRQQSTRYTAKVDVDLEVRSLDGMKNAFTTAHALRTTTLPEDATELERYQIYKDLLDSLMRDLNQSLQQGIDQHLGSFIVP